MAEMLKKEIKVSDSKKQIEKIFAVEVLENVKKAGRRFDIESKRDFLEY